MSVTKKLHFLMFSRPTYMYMAQLTNYYWQQNNFWQTIFSSWSESLYSIPRYVQYKSNAIFLSHLIIFYSVEMCHSLTSAGCLFLRIPLKNLHLNASNLFSSPFVISHVSYFGVFSSNKFCSSFNETLHMVLCRSNIKKFHT